MFIMCMMENDPLYCAEAVLRGEIPPYAELLHDSGMVYRYLTAAKLLFYSSLSCVKLSLLALYQLLLSNGKPKYIVMWRIILVFCVLSYVGSAMTTIFVCDDHKAKYSQGICAKLHEQKRAQFSLWFAYAADVATDLAVMFLPFRMTWNLRLLKSQKFGIFALFSSGWIFILFGTLRVVQVSVKDGVPDVPDPKWLQMWTVIETSMAVMIGCAPAFNALRRQSCPRNVQRSLVQYEGNVEGDRDGHTAETENMDCRQKHGSEEALDPRGPPGLAV